MELKATSLLRLIISGVFLPIIMPWIVYRVVNSWRLTTRVQEKLADKVVLLTGASSGLGEALALELYRAGSRLILASRRIDELERVRTKLISHRSKESMSTYMPTILQLDLSDLSAVPAKIDEALKLHGKIDILINNGGISYRGDVLSTSVDVDVKIMVVNYFGQVALTKAVLPSMIKNNGGHIVGISSVQGRIAIPYRSAYSASKHALQAFFDSLRAETDDNIKVTLISPGYMKTNLSLNALVGNGSTYGVMDRNTATGMPPDVAAQQIINAIVLEKKEVILSSFMPFAAIILRTLCPPVYFLFMRQRAKQQQRESVQEIDVNAGGELVLLQQE